jgi:hypothetical protein
MPSINYNTRDFNSVRTELINYVKQYYPDTLSSFNDAGVGSMLIDLNAAVADMLSYHTDKAFNETKLTSAQERSSLMDIARTYGLKVPFYRPSVTLLNITVTLPPNGDSPDYSYAPIILAGANFNGAGQTFELKDDCDFSNPFNVNGIPNVIIQPITDSDGTIISYNITKQEMVVNGSSSYFKRIITANDIKPFFEVILPDTNVLSIDSVILLDGTNISEIPSYDKFYDKNLLWYEVDSLIDDTIFVPDNNVITTDSTIKRGKYIKTNNRFITEYTDNGFLKLIFGAGTQDITSMSDFNVNSSLINMVGNVINNSSFGVIPKANTTMFVKYRTGGGANTNVGVNVINGIGNMNIFINGSNNAINSAVKQSMRVNNSIPAMGGKDPMSIEEIRNLIRYNFGSQNRAVTLNDYRAIISKMPGIYGIPFRYNVIEEQNKIKIYTLSLNSDGSVSHLSNQTMMENLATFLSDYRMINDYVEVSVGQVYNIGFEVDLFIDKKMPQNQVMAEVIKIIRDYMDISKWQMGDNIYLSQLIEKISSVSGVLNIIDLRAYNKVGGGIYSDIQIKQNLINTTTGQIDLLGENVIYGNPIGFFEIKFPEKDIKVRIKS